MSTSILGLRTAGYRVTDINEAKAWYSKAFNTEPYFNEPFYVGFNIGGFELGLQPVEDGASTGQGGVEVYWGVDDIGAVYLHLLSIGATEHQAPNNVGGDIMVALVKDPWQNLLGIIYNPGFQAK
jgi:lactoylglutathione lyase